jgi:tetrahydromethanopterin S-methyltransferase subunit F
MNRYDEHNQGLAVGVIWAAIILVVVGLIIALIKAKSL